MTRHDLGVAVGCCLLAAGILANLLVVLYVIARIWDARRPLDPEPGESSVEWLDGEQ